MGRNTEYKSGSTLAQIAPVLTAAGIAGVVSSQVIEENADCSCSGLFHYNRKEVAQGITWQHTARGAFRPRL